MPKYKIRKLEIGDYHKGYLDLLQDLTIVGEISEVDFNERLVRIHSNPLHQIWVIESEATKNIVASGTLLVEEKFIHTLARVGHIEDIVVSHSYQGMGFGRQILDHLITKGISLNCYKVILDCSDQMVGFYERIGIQKGTKRDINSNTIHEEYFQRRGAMMRLDIHLDDNRSICHFSQDKETPQNEVE